MFDDLFAMRWGGTMTGRIDPATRNAARAKFLQMFPAANLTTHNPECTLEVESEEPMRNLLLHANGREFEVELHGPYDLNTWTYASIDMGLDDEAAFVGTGKTARGALEDAVRGLIRTPYEDFRRALERESQLALQKLPESDVVQGQDLYKMFCVLKVRK